MKDRKEHHAIKIAINWMIQLMLAAFVASVHGTPSQSYDFVVVGAGAAGCVVAGRLSAENFSVLLLESGGEPDPDMLIPAKTADFFNNPNFVKAYKTVPQSNAGLMNNGEFTYLVGNILGGGSGVNGQVYNRGSPFDYDNWSNITEDPSWNYENMLKYFKMIEDYQGQYDSEVYHGKGGPLPITQPSYTPGLLTFLEAGTELGYSVSSPNSLQTIGFARVEFNRDSKSKRVGAYQGYIEPFLDSRPHLKVIKRAFVNKIIFDGTTAVGVSYLNEAGQQVEVRASKEVILTAGVLSSPVILMKSGIGPREVLDKLGIPVLKDLPVGKNLQDHVYLALYFNVDKSRAELFDPENDLTPDTRELYEETGDGPWSSFSGISGQAFLVSSVRSRETDPNPRWSDINVLLLQTPSRFQVDGMADTSKDDDQSTDEVPISTVINLTRPKSHGTVVLNPDNIEGDPLVNFQYLTHPDDMEATIDSVKQVIQIFEETNAYQEQNARYSTPPIHFCKDFEFRSETDDEYWKCYVRHMTAGSAHAGGTCRMGKPGDPKAVVDSKLRVTGINNLMVCDMSIVPKLPNSNTHAPALAIGEKAADEILKRWRDTKTTDTTQNAKEHHEL